MKKITSFVFTPVLMCICTLANAQTDTTQVVDFTLQEKNITLNVGESYQLHVTPADAPVVWNEFFDFSVNPPFIIDKNGLVTALRSGSSIASVESEGGYNHQNCRVTVTDQGSILKDKKSFAPVDECEWTEAKFTLDNNGHFKAEGAYYGSGAQTNHLNYIVTDQCIFLWFDINYEDSTKMFYPQPFSLEIENCNAQEYTIYYNNKNQVLDSQPKFVMYSIKRGFSAGGTKNTDPVYYYNYDFDNGVSYKEYLVEVPNKLFIKKKSDVEQSEIVSTLNGIIKDQYEIGWIGDICKVKVDDSKVDNIIAELLKEESVMAARRIYCFKSDYDNANKNGVAIGEDQEVCPLNNLPCGVKSDIDTNVLDSIAGALNIDVSKIVTGPYGWVDFMAPKTADIFKVSQKIFDTGYFTYTQPNLYMKVVLAYTTNVTDVPEEIMETQYYNLSGSKIESPSGLTIVVTRYSDGTIRTEKKLF